METACKLAQLWAIKRSLIMIMFVKSVHGRKRAYFMLAKRDVKKLAQELGPQDVWRLWDQGWADGSPYAWREFDSTDCGAMFAGVYYPRR
jgi:hypothetical protein